MRRLNNQLREDCFTNKSFRAKFFNYHIPNQANKEPTNPKLIEIDQVTQTWVYGKMEKRKYIRTSKFSFFIMAVPPPNIPVHDDFFRLGKVNQFPQTMKLNTISKIPLIFFFLRNQKGKIITSINQPNNLLQL